jgi:hypothetical protein
MGTTIVIVALVLFVALVIGLHWSRGGFRFRVREGADVSTPDAEGDTRGAPPGSPTSRPE